MLRNNWSRRWWKRIWGWIMKNHCANNVKVRYAERVQLRRRSEAKSEEIIQITKWCQNPLRRKRQEAGNRKQEAGSREGSRILYIFTTCEVSPQGGAGEQAALLPQSECFVMYGGLCGTSQLHISSQLIQLQHPHFHLSPQEQRQAFT